LEKGAATPDVCMMEKRKILQELKNFMKEVEPINRYSPGSARNIVWVSKIDRRLATMYGETSCERNTFSQIPFLKVHDRPLSQGQRNNHEVSCYEIATQFFKDLIEELALPAEDIITNLSRVHVSHHQNDREIAEVLAELLSTTGVAESSISFSSYDNNNSASIGNWKEAITSQFSLGVLTIPLLSPQYLRSFTCIREFGAASVLSAKVIPVIIPPVVLADLEGFEDSGQVIIITDGISLTNLKNQLESLLSLSPIDAKVWTEKRNEKLAQFLQLIEA